METTVNRHFAIALKELRSAVTWCCWLIGLAILAQVVAWSLLTFTDMRYQVIQETAADETPDVLTAEDVRRSAIREAGEEHEPIAGADVNRQLSSQDRVLGALTGIASAAGTMGTLGLLPLLGLGVVLAAGSATRGVDRAAGAFVWAVLLVMLTLPWGMFFEALPFKGLFTAYSTLVADVEAARGIVTVADSPERSVMGAGALFYGRYLVLPLACLAGIAAIGLRFRAGVEAGLLPREDHRLDPVLEKEASNIKATSLVGGGRSMGALHAAIGQSKPEPETPIRAIRQPTAGVPLQRPI